MERKNKQALIIFILAVATVFLIALLNFNSILHFAQNYVAVYGLPAVLLLAFLGELIDQPFGADSVSVLGISFGLSPYLIFLLAVFGCWTAGLCNFYIGRKYLSRTIEQSCSTKRFGNYCRLYHKYGKVALAFSALIFPYIIMTWISGAFGLRLRDFFLYGLLARAIRIGAIMFIALGVIRILGL